MRPGDVIRHYGGRTSEVNNTDAEGRLVMADAMAYAVAEVEPCRMTGRLPGRLLGVSAAAADAEAAGPSLLVAL